MRDPFAASPEFRKLIRGDEAVDVARINLEIARDADPDLDEQAAFDRIEALAGRIRQRCPLDSRAAHIIGQINWVLFVEEEFRGNVEDYYDPRNSYLHDLLDRRVGIPISMSVLYMALGDRVGLPLSGVSLPIHFLLRATDEEPAMFVDPYHEGTILDREGCERLIGRLTGHPVRLGFEHFTPSSPSTVVARMLRNLKSIYLDRQDFAAALPVVRRLAALNARDLIEQRDWGMTSLQADRPGEAVAPLQRYVENSPQADDVESIRNLLKAARREVAFRN